MKNTLTHHEAFKAMRLFLEGYYKRNHSNDIGVLLGDVQILEDGGTADPAAWKDWVDCVNRVKK